jgi:hypothetical protein
VRCLEWRKKSSPPPASAGEFFFVPSATLNITATRATLCRHIFTPRSRFTLKWRRQFKMFMLNCETKYSHFGRTRELNEVCKKVNLEPLAEARRIAQSRGNYPKPPAHKILLFTSHLHLKFMRRREKRAQSKPHSIPQQPRSRSVVNFPSPALGDALEVSEIFHVFQEQNYTPM